MRTRLRSVVDAILGRVPGQNGAADVATRMAMDADLSHRGELSHRGRSEMINPSKSLTRWRPSG